MRNHDYLLLLIAKRYEYSTMEGFMDLTQLYYFISVAKNRNFTTTASEFFVSQPCISHQIKDLEKELGSELFIRNTRSVELTVAGEIFLQDAKLIVDIMEQSKSKLQQNKGQSMSLSITHLASPSHIFLPAIIKRFRTRYPNIKVNLCRQDALQIAQSALAHRYDIYCSMTLDMMAVTSLATKKIQADHYCIVTPKDHPAVAHISIDYEKLASEPFVLFNPEHAVTMNQQILQICRQLGFSPRVTGSYHLYEDLLYAVECGLGITILPYRTKNYMNSSLTYSLLDVSNISADLSLAWEQNITNPAVPLFLDVFWEYMQENPDQFA
jgi:DNA-binding transcriptional LysR family regulator